MSKISICSASLAVDVQPFVSTEQTRYYLNGFALQKHPTEGAYIVATDGHRAGIFHDATAQVAENCIVQLDKDFLKKARGRCTYPLFVYIDHTPSKGMAYLAGAIDEGDILPDDLSQLPSLLAICPAILIDGTFPDWQRVCPSGVDFGLGTTAINGFNPKYLGVYASLGGGIIVRSGSIGAPSWVFVSGRHDFVGIIMPLRVSHDSPPRLAVPCAPARGTSG